ncbi:hypothetical protein BT93_A0572 [Corymbia citriodora subsp. variegata]|nr:hypothetical protein BT93_A0572 [Corymbia citriodora subsp. variegata]
MQSGFPPVSWPFQDLTNSTISPLGNYSSSFDFNVGDYGMIPSPISDTTDDSAVQFEARAAFDVSLGVGYELEDFTMDFEGLEAFFNGDEPENACDYSEMSDGSFALQKATMEAWSPASTLSKSEESNSASVSAATGLPWTLPAGEMEINNLLGLHHLLKAYGEAGDLKQKELMEVISRRIAEKSSPLGEVLERLAFYLCQTPEDRSGYLTHELCKNFKAAFLAFYQAFPYGRFAHFAANSALLEAMPDEAETVHIVDFDMGEGIQWPPVIEAVVRRNKMLKLTSVTCEEQRCDQNAQLNWNFNDMKRRLHDHARSFGMELQVDSMNIANLANELRKRKEGDANKEWTVFNCMVGLPHMGRTATARRVNDFFSVAKEFLANHADRFSHTAGIITFGDGNGFEKRRNCSTFGEFFDNSLMRYHSILESMQSDLPPQLLESRIAMETLFIAPFVLSLSWLHRWGETRNGADTPATQGLDRSRVGRETVVEAQEMLRGKTSYEVKLGEQGNEMVLEWKGHELVRFSAWEYRPKRWQTRFSF